MTKILPSIAKVTKFNYPIDRKWYLIDVAGKPLGRVASIISQLLMGKNKPYYSHDRDCGDFVIAINAGKILLTGKKLEQKMYFKHSGFLGNAKFIPYKKLLPQKADFVLKEAVKGMLPKNKLRAKMIKRLKIFINSEYKCPVKDIIKKEI